MISEEEIRSVVQRIIAAAKPSKVILIGSYARGEADEDSDLDLMVIEPSVENVGREMVRLHRAAGDIGIGVDVLVYSEEDAARRGKVPGTIVYWALKEGEVVYDASS